MGLFSSIFGKGDQNEVRKLDRPDQLKKGDIVNFGSSFALPSQLREKSFQIEEVHTYEYEDETVTSFLLHGEGADQLFLSVVDDDTDYLLISMKLERPVVEEMFDIEQFAEIFDGDGHLVLKRKAEPASVSGWTAALYRQEEMAERGYFHRKDYRGQTIPEQEGELFDYYMLVSDDRNYLLEAEVYEGGETDVGLVIRRPLSDIAEMWPG